jgi:hypothetical protein
VRRIRDDGAEWAELGRKAVVTWAGVEISKENRDGLPWPLGRIDGLNRRAYRTFFQIYFRDFDSNQRVLKYFQTKFELNSK